MAMSNLLDRVRAAALPVVVEVWAPWCGPCRSMAPALERVSRAYAGRVELLKLNADEDPQAVRALGVLGVPTLLVFRQGHEVARRTGALPAEGLTALFDAALSEEPHPIVAPTRSERVLRLGAAALLAVMGLASGPAWLLVGAGGLVAFSAVYDRCPIWRALWPRLVQRWRPR